MAKQIVAWCDVHMARDENVPASSFRVALDGSQPVEVDLCETCDKELLGALRELIEEVGQPVSTRMAHPTSGGSEKAACPECGNELTKEGMRKHMMRAHGKTRIQAGEIVRGLGYTKKRDQQAGSYICPECQDEFDTPQGRGAHRRSVHDVVGTPT